eukprot:403332504
METQDTQGNFPSTPLHLTYWNCRGRTQHVRYVLEAIEVPYEETRYEISQYQDWIDKDKPELEGTLALPNLPHLKDGDVHITEHDAIMRYLARKYKPEMLGRNDKEYALMENYLCYITKFYMKLGEFCYYTDPTEENRLKHIESLHSEMSKFDKIFQESY